MGMERYIRRMPRSVVLLADPADPELVRSLRGQRCWLVTSWTSMTPQSLLPGCLAKTINNYALTAILYEVTWPDKQERKAP
jgi:hypothetical protein